VTAAAAQTNAPLSFEAATLKQVPDDDAAPLSAFPHLRGDRFTWNDSLGDLLSYAYRIPRTQITGIEKDRHFYAVVGIMSTSTTDEQARVMLQTLLVDSMNIECHRDKKQVQGYVLSIAKGGPKLKAAVETDPLPPMPEFMNGMSLKAYAGRVVTNFLAPGVAAVLGRGASMSQLAAELSVDLKVPVIDQTGLTGKYYFGFEFQSSNQPTDSPAENDALAASIFSALPAGLGLRLEGKNVSAEYLVIDHFEGPIQK